VLGVRPEHVAVGGAGGVAARVVDLVPEGREMVVGLELEGGIEMRSIVPSTLELVIGQSVRVAIEEAYIHLFDGANGAALHHGGHSRTGAA
jgi:ABC-type sugar transport system ATPase subunit